MIISESANIINSLGIESKTKYSIEIINEDDFEELEVFLKNNKLPILFLGEGTNIIPPNFFNGVVIRSFCKNINFRKDINILTVDSELLLIYSSIFNNIILSFSFTHIFTLFKYFNCDICMFFK